MSKSFEDFCDNKAAESVARFNEIIESAMIRAGSAAGRDFVYSCKKQFETKGFLTPAQVAALKTVGENPWDNDESEWNSFDEFDGDRH